MFRSTGSLQELSTTKEENKNKYGRLEKSENPQNSRTHHSHNENNYENVDLQASPRNSQNYENELREKVLSHKKDASVVKPTEKNNTYGVVKKESSPELDVAEESVILVSSDFESGNQKNLIVKPITSNLRPAAANNLRNSTRIINGKSYPNIRNCGGNSPDGNSPPKEIGKLNNVVKNSSSPQVQVHNKQLKSINTGKVVASRQGNGVSSNNSSSRGQRLPHRHVSVEELRLFQVR